MNDFLIFGETDNFIKLIDVFSVELNTIDFSVICKATSEFNKKRGISSSKFDGGSSVDVFYPDEPHPLYININEGFSHIFPISPDKELTKSKVKYIFNKHEIIDKFFNDVDKLCSYYEDNNITKISKQISYLKTKIVINENHSTLEKIKTSNKISAIFDLELNIKNNKNYIQKNIKTLKKIKKDRIFNEEIKLEFNAILENTYILDKIVSLYQEVNKL